MIPVNEDFCEYGLFIDDEMHGKSDIKSVEMIPTDANKCRILCDGKSVWAGATFRAGDIVETCPTRDISKTSLYSRDVRDLAFEVVQNTEYVIPMGYCQFYDIDDGMNGEPNCDWEWDAEKRVIVIRAIRKIRKGERLVLNISE